jgi:hypothetical protein
MRIVKGDEKKSRCLSACILQHSSVSVVTAGWTTGELRFCSGQKEMFHFNNYKETGSKALLHVSEYQRFTVVNADGSQS